MNCHKMSLREAFELVAKYRSDLQPNDTFLQILLDYEEKLYGKSSMKFKEFEKKKK
jgi:hypothetical protein